MDWVLRPTAPELAARYRAEGWWTDDTFPSLAMDGLAAARAAPCVIRSKVRPFRGTIGDVGDQGLRLAGYLASKGVGPGDVVAFQLPNWAEAAACFYGLLPLGAVLVPAVHIYGPAEMGHILRQSRARVLITAERFGRQDYLANLEAVLPLPDLELVVVVPTEDGDRPGLPVPGVTWRDAVTGSDRLERPSRVEPDSPVVVGYTSGTTAAPKGVIHTHRSLLAELRTWAAFMAEDPGAGAPAPGSAPTALPGPPGTVSGSPLSHVTGLLGVLRPLQHGSPLDLIDSWDPGAVLEAMSREGCSVAGGATFFLISLLDHPAFDPGAHLPQMARMSLGGSPIPTEVAERARALGISLTRAYGSTEHPSITGALHSDPPEKTFLTDGRALPATEITVVDPGGQELPAGEPGEIWSRGPELFAGYVDAGLNTDAVDAAGWYRTGDIGVLDADGWLTITDRKKDIIIRGGENVSAAEVEGVLATMAEVAEVAVVAAPDPRYGEHGCGVFRLRPGAAPFALDRMREHLDRGGLARQKWPEEILFVDDFPRTASGKIQKHVLRDLLRRGGRAPRPG